MMTLFKEAYMCHLASMSWYEILFSNVVYIEYNICVKIYSVSIVDTHCLVLKHYISACKYVPMSLQLFIG